MRKSWIVAGAVGLVLFATLLGAGVVARAAGGVSLADACKGTGYKFIPIDDNNFLFKFKGEFGETWNIVASTQPDYEYVVIWTTVVKLGGKPSQDLAIRCLELNNSYAASFIAYDSKNNDLDCQMAIYKPALSGELLKDALRQVITMADNEYRKIRQMSQT